MAENVVSLFKKNLRGEIKQKTSLRVMGCEGVFRGFPLSEDLRGMSYGG